MTRDVIVVSMRTCGASALVFNHSGSKYTVPASTEHCSSENVLKRLCGSIVQLDADQDPQVTSAPPTFAANPTTPDQEILGSNPNMVRKRLSFNLFMIHKNRS